MSGRDHASYPGSRVLLPLDTARQCFTYLVTGPEPLSVDGRAFSGLPNRPVPLDELRDRMLRRRFPRHTRDAVWAHLVQRSRTEGATWTLACTGMALPALAGIARRLAARYPGDAFDAHAEVLSGFLTALADIDLRRPRVLVRLRWAAYRSGGAALAEALDAPPPIAPDSFRSTPPKPPWGHPDLVLARAVRLGVLTRTEADLIGSTRLDEDSLADWAAAHQMSAEAAYKARKRAEHRLIDFVRERVRDTDPGDPVAYSVTVNSSPDASPQTPAPSRSVTAVGGGGRGDTAEKPSVRVSKTGSKSGLLRCGGSPPPALDPSSSEVPRCA
ncbi:hypothetical protein DVA86_31425 [Streptomyces armeniacus]|uniref:Uncharacterized protein n=1 Tax=Streptomyces armeniacus TaxID=83291 RepID=A0A345XXR1_9ACTN|nr:hypothetical protein [Streptomyces armeniacus]AXK36427.1 hypothetical protein DVA86_31425 [Streptomyces armeniacus]